MDSNTARMSSGVKRKANADPADDLAAASYLDSALGLMQQQQSQQQQQQMYALMANAGPADGFFGNGMDHQQAPPMLEFADFASLPMSMDMFNLCMPADLCMQMTDVNGNMMGLQDMTMDASAMDMNMLLGSEGFPYALPSNGGFQGIDPAAYHQLMSMPIQLPDTPPSGPCVSAPFPQSAPTSSVTNTSPLYESAAMPSMPPEPAQLRRGSEPASQQQMQQQQEDQMRASAHAAPHSHNAQQYHMQQQQQFQQQEQFQQQQQFARNMSLSPPTNNVYPSHLNGNPCYLSSQSPPSHHSSPSPEAFCSYAGSPEQYYDAPSQQQQMQHEQMQQQQMQQQHQQMAQQEQHQQQMAEQEQRHYEHQQQLAQAHQEQINQQLQNEHQQLVAAHQQQQVYLQQQQQQDQVHQGAQQQQQQQATYQQPTQQPTIQYQQQQPPQQQLQQQHVQQQQHMSVPPSSPRQVVAQKPSYPQRPAQPPQTSPEMQQQHTIAPVPEQSTARPHKARRTNKTSSPGQSAAQPVPNTQQTRDMPPPPPPAPARRHVAPTAAPAASAIADSAAMPPPPRPRRHPADNPCLYDCPSSAHKAPAASSSSSLSSTSSSSSDASLPVRSAQTTVSGSHQPSSSSSSTSSSLLQAIRAAPRDPDRPTTEEMIALQAKTQFPMSKRDQELFRRYNDENISVDDIVGAEPDSINAYQRRLGNLEDFCRMRILSERLAKDVLKARNLARLAAQHPQ